MTVNVVRDAYRAHYEVTGVALDRDGISVAQKTVTGVAFAITGALASGGTYTAGDGYRCKVGHLIGVYSSANIASKQFLVTGTDPDGLAVSEVVTGINNSTVFTTKYFYTVTSIIPDTTDAVNDVEVGIGTTFATQRVAITNKTNGGRIGMGVEGYGTFNVTAQLTMTDLNDVDETPQYVADTSFAAKTAPYFQDLGVLCTAVRLIANSYSSGMTTIFHVIQSN